MSTDVPPPPEAGPPPTPVPGSASEERTWAMLAHLAGLLLFISVPLANIIGPLVVWLIKKDTMPLVDDQGKEALNFQISVTIYLIVSAILIIGMIGIVLVPAVIIFDVVVTIIAAIKANQGEAYRYPLCIRFIK